MRTIIAGSRTILDPNHVEDAVKKSDFSITEIVSGGARGVDYLGQLYGEYHGIPVRIMNAEWDKYGKSAGYKRNEQMAQYAQACIVIWDGQSKGSKHMINIAQRYNLKLFVYKVDQ